MLFTAAGPEVKRTVCVDRGHDPVLFHDIAVLVAFSLRRDVSGPLPWRRAYFRLGEYDSAADFEIAFLQWLSILTRAVQSGWAQGARRSDLGRRFYPLAANPAAVLPSILPEIPSFNNGFTSDPKTR